VPPLLPSSRDAHENKTFASGTLVWYPDDSSVFQDFLNFKFQDKWFKTGDTAKLEDGAFKILGRTSVDIIKWVQNFQAL
jgi:acyl-CoA synthetase (AMP-forming)/AMP-acid ligase II